MIFETILFEIEGNIAIITINRPDKLNALNTTVVEELRKAIKEIIKNPEIKSAIITGSGEKAFVAGADIAGFKNMDAVSAHELSRKGQALFDRIENSPKPIVAAVNGFALGGGCELAMACHFRLASSNAKFGQPEVNLGLIPGYGGTQRLTQLIGKGRALEMMLTGNMIDAVTAFNYGLVNHVVGSAELLLKAKSILSIINTKAPLAIAGCIEAAQLTYESEKRGYEKEAEIFCKLIVSKDAKEGIDAFLEKRTATFRGN